MIRSWFGLLILFILLAPGQPNRFTVLSDWRIHDQRWVERQEGSYMLFRRLNERSFAHLDERDREVVTIHTAALRIPPAGTEGRRGVPRRLCFGQLPN